MINILEITITLILLLLGDKISDSYKSENVEMHLDICFVALFVLFHQITLQRKTE